MTDRSILLVEDSPDDEELELMAFKQSRLFNDIVVVRDGADALDYLFGTGSFAGCAVRLPQVIILDLKLPKLGGLDVLKRIRAHPPTALVPVVVMTSSIQESDLVSSYQLGANSYVRKPVEFQSLINKVQMVGNYWMLINQTAAVSLKP